MGNLGFYVLYTLGHGNAVLTGRGISSTHKIIFRCVKGTIVWTLVRHSKHAKWRDQDSPIWTYWGAKQPLHGILGVSWWRGHRRLGWNVTGLLTKAHWEAISGSVGCGQSWGGLSGGPWDNLWPYGFGLGVRRAHHFRCNHLWTCVCRQSLMLKTQRMGNSRGLSFKIDFCDPLIVRYCQVTLRVS